MSNRAPVRHDWMLRAAAALAAIVSVLAVLFRQAGVPRYRTVWAEDGQVFGQCAFTEPSPAACLFQGYDGWLHLASRALAWAASLVPPAMFSYAITLAAALATGAAAALVTRALAHPGSPSERPSSTVARALALAPAVLAGASVALVFPAGAEVAGNISNLHWILFVASVAVICCTLLGHRFDRWDAALVAVTVASSPFGLLLVALLVGANVVAPEGCRPGWRLAVAAVVISLVQLGTLFVSPRNELPDAVVTLLSPVGWLIDQLFRRGPFGGRGLIPGWFVGTLATLAFGLLVVVIARRGSPAHLGSAVRDRLERWRPPLALVALGGACAAAFAASTFLNRHDAARYDLIPTAGLVMVLVLAASLLVTELQGVLVARRAVHLKSALAAAVSLVLVVGYASTFRVTTGASRGPSYPAAFREAAAACDAGATEAVIEIAPLASGAIESTWHLRVPCARIRS